MIKYVYIAAPFQLKTEARVLRTFLQRHGITVTARWLDGSLTTERENALTCLQDVRAAQALVLLNPEVWEDRGTGGRHTELGYALALGYPVFLHGQPSNAFHHLPQVRNTGYYWQLIQLLDETSAIAWAHLEHP